MTDALLLRYDPAPSRVARILSDNPPASVALPSPDLEAGMPLMQALSRRMSTRQFAAAPLTPAELGALTWAANGVNREAGGGRTAPSAHAFNEIDLYLALPEGVYRYDPPSHRLLLKHAIDARGMTGYQDFVSAAPLDLVYVVRYSALLSMPEQQRAVFSAVSAGAIAQNVALYCASAGLGAVVRGWIDHRVLADALRLNEDEVPILAQTVGHVEDA